MAVITNETKKIIKTSVEMMTSNVVESVHIGLTEDMPLNDPGFYEEFEKRLDEAQEYITKEINGENDIPVPAEDFVKGLHEMLDEIEHYEGANYNECKR